jgi:hypothetical protein
MMVEEQWEYHVEVLGGALRGVKAEELETYLNQAGEEGWALVCVHQPQNSNRLWVNMKRRLTVATRRRRNRMEDAW